MGVLKGSAGLGGLELGTFHADGCTVGNVRRGILSFLRVFVDDCLTCAVIDSGGVKCV